MNLADMQQSSLTISSSIGVERWGALPGGDTVKLFVLRNAQGMRVSVSDLGATLVSWHAPDRAGRVSDIVLGHDTPADYLAGRAFMGGTIGRCANRIQNACFTLDGLTYSLDRNDGHHSLHGGAAGSIRPVATLYDPVSGRELSVWTDAAGMQFYTGNHLSDTAGRHGQRYDKHAGLCLETGAFPNQVNMDSAGGIILRPGERYRHTTQYWLGVR